MTSSADLWDFCLRRPRVVWPLAEMAPLYPPLPFPLSPLPPGGPLAPSVFPPGFSKAASSPLLSPGAAAPAAGPFPPLGGCSAGASAADSTVQREAGL